MLVKGLCSTLPYKERDASINVTPQGCRDGGNWNTVPVGRGVRQGGFSVGATRWGRRQDRGACVGMPTHPLPGKGRAAPLLAVYPDQLDCLAAWERGVQPVSCPPPSLLAQSALPWGQETGEGGGERLETGALSGQGGRADGASLPFVSPELHPPPR